MSTNLSEIRAALAAATPGPWVFSDSTDPRGAKGEFRARGPWNGFMLVGPWCNDADPILIANAPAWLAELVDRVEAAESAAGRAAAIHAKGFSIEWQLPQCDACGERWPCATTRALNTCEHRYLRNDAGERCDRCGDYR